jgi:polyhydroxyalkanoate synthesis regulator phasin
MLNRGRLAIGGMLALATVGVAWAAGDWSAAQNRFERFKDEQQALKKMTPEETRKIVQAICEARSTKERRAVGSAIASRVKDDVGSDVDKLRRSRDETVRLLDEVIADSNLADNHSSAQRLKAEAIERWEMVERMTQALRGGNHPVIAFMSEQGMRAHVERQERCDAHEFTLSNGRVDCLMASGENCKVIELKPDNSKAISDGREQADRYVRELTAELKDPNSSTIKKLIDKDSDFKRCKEFTRQVDCYKLCPDVNEDGTIHEQNASWRSDCS